jgi:hypothetical protein
VRICRAGAGRGVSWSGAVSGRRNGGRSLAGRISAREAARREEERSRSGFGRRFGSGDGGSWTANALFWCGIVV